MSSSPIASNAAAPASETSWMRHWLEEEVLPSVILFALVVSPAVLYWYGLASPSNIVGFVGVYCCGAYFTHRTTRRRIARARDIASLHKLTDLDAQTLKQMIGHIPPWVRVPTHTPSPTLQPPKVCARQL